VGETTGKRPGNPWLQTPHQGLKSIPAVSVLSDLLPGILTSRTSRRPGPEAGTRIPLSLRPKPPRPRLRLLVSVEKPKQSKPYQGA